MVVKIDDGFATSQEYDHELELRDPRDLEFNIPYGKKHGNTELDRRATELFDLIPTPYNRYTHSTIYHQRMFNWEDGINWSNQNPTNQIDQGREKRVLQRIWTHTVGSDYVTATRELNRRGSLSRGKKESLESTRASIQKTNLMAKYFPEGPPESVEELIETNLPA